MQSEMFMQMFDTGRLRLEMPDADVLLFERFFDEAESRRHFEELLANVPWQQDDFTIHGRTIPVPRLTAWYGDDRKRYAYSGLIREARAWSPVLLGIKRRVEAQAGMRFNTALLNYYRDGRDSVAWHSDDERELGRNPVVASVSFGASREFRMKHLRRREVPRVDIPLHDGSLLLMRGATQHFWRHQVPKTARPVGQRINITFRVVR